MGRTMAMQQLSRHVGLGALALVALGGVACGGAPKPKPVAEAEAAAEGGDAVDGDELSQADEQYQALQTLLDKVGEGKAVNVDWLEGQLRAVLELDDEHVPTRFNLAALRELRGDRAGARAAYEELARGNPPYAPAAENLASYLVEEGKVAEAVEIYRGNISRDAKNTTSRLALARIMLAEKRNDEVMQLAREVLQRQSTSLEAFRVLALAYKAEKDLPMAQLVIARGLKVDKEDPELNYVAAQIALDKGELVLGVHLLKQVIAKDPQWTRVRGHLAQIALAYRDFGNAAQQYEAILKTQPNNQEVRLALAVSYKGLGRLGEAEQLYKHVLEQQKDDVAALWNLAVLYHRHLGRFDEAIALYRRAKTAGPNDEALRQADAYITDAERQKNDQAAVKEREEREAKRKTAVAAICAAVAEGKKPDLESLGDEQERVGTAWQVFVNGQQSMQDGALAEGEAAIKCSFVMVPDSPKGNAEACAPMRVMWAQILFQLGRADEALVTVREGLKCDPENPDAKLIEQQLLELQQQGAGPAVPAAAGEE